jgi:hypothetical protein
MGIAEFTPRMTFSGPIVKDRLAFTESLEYRYERDQVYSLPHCKTTRELKPSPPTPNST